MGEGGRHRILSAADEGRITPRRPRRERGGGGRGRPAISAARARRGGGSHRSSASLDGQARSRLVGRCSCTGRNQGGHLRQTRGVESCIDFIGSMLQKRRQKVKHLIESTGAWPPPGPSKFECHSSRGVSRNAPNPEKMLKSSKRAAKISKTLQENQPSELC